MFIQCVGACLVNLRKIANDGPVEVRKGCSLVCARIAYEQVNDDQYNNSVDVRPHVVETNNQQS